MTQEEKTKREKHVEQEMANYDGREGFIGQMGFGGSVIQWHPELKIGFGYVPFDLNILDRRNIRGAILQKAVKECVIKLNEKS